MLSPDKLEYLCVVSKEALAECGQKTGEYRKAGGPLVSSPMS